MLTVGSLFSGIGGFDLGFERAGMRTAWFVEIEPFCQAVLRKHWPQTPIHSDVTEVGAEDLEPVDLVCGGFPCQDISTAGRGEGLTGSRSGLWFEMLRIVGELRPRWVVVENVPVLRTRGLHTVLEGLASCGYDAEWDGIPAYAVGAHHQRDRIWIVAYPRGERRWEDARGAPGDEAADGWWSQADHVACRASSSRVPPGPGPLDGRQDVADAARHAEAGVQAPAGAERERAGASGAGSRARGRALVADAAAGVERHGRRGERVRHLPANALPEGGQARQVPPGGSDRDGDRGGPCGAGGAADAQPEAGHGAEPELGGVADGVPCGMDGRWLESDVPRVHVRQPGDIDRLRAVGNALVPQIAEWIGLRILEHEAAA